MNVLILQSPNYITQKLPPLPATVVATRGTWGVKVLILGQERQVSECYFANKESFTRARAYGRKLAREVTDLLVSERMRVCPECGNKRCPKATDSRNYCSGSNEPGQEGSDFQ